MHVLYTLAVGGVLSLMAFSIVFLLCFTALRDAPTWHKLLFTLPTPVTPYFSISLLAISGSRTMMEYVLSPVMKATNEAGRER